MEYNYHFIISAALGARARSRWPFNLASLGLDEPCAWPGYDELVKAPSGLAARSRPRSRPRPRARARSGAPPAIGAYRMAPSQLGPDPARRPAPIEPAGRARGPALKEKRSIIDILIGRRGPVDARERPLTTGAHTGAGRRARDGQIDGEADRRRTGARADGRTGARAHGHSGIRAFGRARRAAARMHLAAGAHLGPFSSCAAEIIWRQANASAGRQSHARACAPPLSVGAWAPPTGGADVAARGRLVARA